MKNIWLSADYHLGENRFDLMGRPFKSTEEHDNTIINNHNLLVDPDDMVIVVGDAVYQKSPESLHLIGKMNGIKILIRGNHDVVFTDEQLKQYFHTIIKDGGGMEMSIGGVDCWLTHYPSTGRPDRFNIVGHIHSAWKFQLNSLNVGVDVNHWRPVNSTKIPFFLNTIKDHYDDDVWVAYNPINQGYHKNGRGKNGSYFKKKNK